jgi:hypothetical protein
VALRWLEAQPHWDMVPPPARLAPSVQASKAPATRVSQGIKMHIERVRYREDFDEEWLDMSTAELGGGQTKTTYEARPGGIPRY